MPKHSFIAGNAGYYGLCLVESLHNAVQQAKDVDILATGGPGGFIRGEGRSGFAFAIVGESRITAPVRGCAIIQGAASIAACAPAG